MLIRLTVASNNWLLNGNRSVLNPAATIWSNISSTLRAVRPIGTGVGVGAGVAVAAGVVVGAAVAVAATTVAVGRAIAGSVECSRTSLAASVATAAVTSRPGTRARMERQSRISA